MIFSKVFKKLKFLMFSKKISILLLETVAVLSGVANLAFEYNCSYSCSFRDLRFVGFFQDFSKNLDIKNHKN